MAVPDMVNLPQKILFDWLALRYDWGDEFVFRAVTAVCLPPFFPICLGPVCGRTAPPAGGDGTIHHTG